MDFDDGKPEQRSGTFPATRWTWVDGADTMSETERLKMLEAFLIMYRPALLAYLTTRFRLTQPDAEDAVQDFIMDKIIGRNLLASADRARGRFRTFLCQSMNRFMIDRMRKATALKRAPDHATVPLDSFSETELHRQIDAGRIEFDDAFFRQAIHETLIRMRSRCDATNRRVLWHLFEERVLRRVFEADRPLPYNQLLPLLRLNTVDQASNLLTNAKRMFVRVLRSVIRDYSATDEELADELTALKTILEKHS